MPWLSILLRAPISEFPVYHPQRAHSSYFRLCMWRRSFGRGAGGFKAVLKVNRPNAEVRFFTGWLIPQIVTWVHRLSCFYFDISWHKKHKRNNYNNIISGYIPCAVDGPASGPVLLAHWYDSDNVWQCISPGMNWRPMSAGMGSSDPATLKRISGFR